MQVIQVHYLLLVVLLDLHLAEIVMVMLVSDSWKVLYLCLHVLNLRLEYVNLTLALLVNEVYFFQLEVLLFNYLVLELLFGANLDLILVELLLKESGPSVLKLSFLLQFQFELMNLLFQQLYLPIFIVLNFCTLRVWLVWLRQLVNLDLLMLPYFVL